MISVSGRKWQEKIVNSNLVEKFQQNEYFSETLSKLIVSRNFDEKEIHLIKNDLTLTNVFQKNPDFVKSVELVVNSIKYRENICILGDYDVDGSSACSLLVRIFKSLNQPHFYYIPDREKDGYGASKKLFEKLIIKKPKLLIMVDCGSTSNEAVEFLNENNIKSLIIDHHEIDKPYPKANVIINPKKDNGYLEYDYLCATSLTYFFLELLIKRIKAKINIKKYLIYVLLATVCDVMPLRKLNRQIALKVIKEFDINDNLVFKEIYHLINKNNKVSISDLGYFIGPILNAGGRIGKSEHATELLSSNDSNIIKQRSLELFNLNIKRRIIESRILKNINFRELTNNKDKIIIYYDANIKDGLIGIIASRLKDYFNRPSIVLTKSNNLLKGSARSINGYNIGKVIKILLDKKIVINGGGHNMAAGFSLNEKNFLKFKTFIQKDYFKKSIHLDDSCYYDSELSSGRLSQEFFNDLKKIEPFGSGNPTPSFLFKDLKVIKYNILKEKHISCILKSRIGSSLNSICFDSINTQIGEHLQNYKKTFNVIAHINESFWNNKKFLQLVIKDLIL